MKKIYMILAAISLLSLSLNAQVVESKAFNKSGVHPTQTTTVAKAKAQIPTMNELLSGINGMSSILQAASNTDAASSAAGAWRAPLKINADEYTVGPFEGDNVGSTAMGYHSAYPDPQWITVTTELTRDEFINYVGDEIVGFRLALGGNTSRIHKVSDFIAYPRTASSFDMDNIHTWNLPNIAGAASVDSYGDIVIEANNGYVGFKSIIVYSGSTVVTQWVGATDETTTPSSWVWTSTSHFASNNDGSYFMTYGSSSGGGIITIPSSLFNDRGYSGDLTVVINAGVDAGYGTQNLGITVNGTEKTVTNENPSFQDFTWTIPPTGSTTPNYVELNGGYTGDGGNWHEFYLPEPIVFNVASDVEALRMGYTVLQYPTNEETYYRFPIGLNDQSTGHNHYVFRYGPETSTSTGELTGWYASSGSYAVPNGWSARNGSGTVTSFSDNDDGSMWLSGGGTITIPASMLNGNSTVQVIINAAKYSGSNRTLSVNGASQTLSSTTFSDFTWNNVDATNGITISLGDSYVSIMSISIVGQVTTTTYVQQWYTADYSERGDLTVQLIFKSQIPKTEKPTITVGDPTATDVTVTATATDPTAEVTLTIGDRTETGIGSVSITIDRGTADQNLTATATAQEDGKRVSDEATAPVYVPALPITATPVITYEVVGNNMVITATGNGTVTLEADGQSASGDGSAQIIIPLGNDERTVTATATAIEPNHQRSATATETINIPEFGRSPMPNITMTNNGDGTYTITVTGTGEVSVYIDDAEHGGTAGDPIATGNGSVSFTVEEHSREMTITVQATNQEGDLAVSRTAEETYTIPAMNMSGYTLLDPQPENASTPIDMSKLMFVDRFSVDIPEDNSHPFMYKYTLKETQVRQRSSNDVEVYVEKTGSKGQGFYTLKQIDDDKDAKLTMDVENAAMDFNLSELSSPFFYTVEREEEADGERYWGWNAILQRTSIGNYRQTLKYDAKGNLVYNYNDSVAPGPHVQLDLDTITGDYNDYKAYVPVVWTMGFDRVNYDENNPTHNSYGASVWTTGVADVAMASSEAPKAERQTNSWNSVNWTAEGGPASLYILDNVVATATMPTVNTLDYEPYMFRIFVKSDNNKLRPYTVVPAGDGPYDGEHLDAGEGTTKGPICVWSGYINDPKNNQPKKLTTENGEIDNPDYNGVEITEGTGDGGAVTYTFKKVKVDRPAGYDENHNPLGPWDQDDVNAMFGALDELANMTTISLADLEVFVRFYYIVKGTGEGHTPWIPTRANAESDPAGYGTQSPGKAPDPATGVIEIANHGEIVETIYYNMQGMTSDKPFDGINIVVNRYSDGAISVTKVITK